MPQVDGAGPFPLPPSLGQGPAVPPDSGPPDEGTVSGDGLLRLVYQVDKALDAIARVHPEVASAIDKVKTSLRDVIATAGKQGASTPKKRGLSSMGMSPMDKV